MTVAEDRPTIAGLLREGIRSTFSDRRGLLFYGLMPALLLTAAWYIDDLKVFGDVAGHFQLMSIGAQFGLCALAFAWQRRYLIGPERDTRPPSWSGDDGYWRVSGLALVYMLRAVLLFGTIKFTDAAVMTVFEHGFQGAVPEDAAFLPGLLVGSLLYMATALLYVATARFLLVFPAYASGKRMSWLQSWRLCKGHGLRLGVAVVLTWLPEIAIVELSFGLLVPVPGGIAGEVILDLLIAGSQVLGLLVALSMTACLYKRLTEPAGLSDVE